MVGGLTIRDDIGTVPGISVLLPTKNAGPGFKLVLEALFQQEIDRPFEVVMVDSGSTDGTLELAAQYPVRMYSIVPGAFGHGSARNVLARLAAGDTLVFLSSDGIPIGRRWLADLIAPLADCGIAATYGRQLPAGNADLTETFLLQHFYPAEPARRSLRGDSAPLAHTILFSHVNAACKKAVWERYPYDETVIMSEDLDWSRTVLVAGYEIMYVPAAAVTHSHAYTLTSLFKRNFDSGASLRDVTSDTMSDWLAQGARYLGSELRFLVRSGNGHHIPRACVREAVRCVGFLAGFHHTHIPVRFKAHLSQHSYHWEQSGDGKGSDTPLPLSMPMRGASPPLSFETRAE